MADAIWGSSVGAAPFFGASKHSGPSDLGGGPAWTFDKVRDRTVLHTPLLDAQGRLITVTARSRIAVWSPEVGRQVLVAKVPGDGALAHCPAVSGDFLYFNTIKGEACCMDIGKDPADVKFVEQICARCLPDQSACALGAGILVFAGVQGALGALPIADHIYAVSIATGALAWKVELLSPSARVIPSIVSNTVIYMSSAGHVICASSHSGEIKWQAAGSTRSFSTGGALPSGNKIYVTSNRHAKRVWNKPFGGKGLVRAFNLSDGEMVWQMPFDDLEANTVPSVCLAGPGGKAAVIVALGANPGFPLNSTSGVATGNEWHGAVKALSTEDGSILWSFEPPVWTGHACASISLVDDFQGPAAWCIPVTGANGTVYCNWNANGTMYALAGATGEELSKFEFATFFTGASVIAPGRVYVVTKCCWCVFASDARQKTILRPLQVPFAESGTEHHWPNKCGPEPSHFALASVRAPRDLSKPSWVYRTPQHILDDWFGNSVTCDAQRNLYVNTGNFSDTFVIRSDGTLRGSVYLGPHTSPASLEGTSFYVCDNYGFAYSVDIESLKINWKIKYTDWTQPDSYALLVHDGILYLPGCEYPPLDLDFLGKCGGKFYESCGHNIFYALDTKTGKTIWKQTIPYTDANGEATVCWNFTPVIFKDRIVIMDIRLGCNCYNKDTGEQYWSHLGKNAVFSTGNQCGGSNGLVYYTGNLQGRTDIERFKNRGRGVVMARDIMTGDFKWERDCPSEAAMTVPCHQGGSVVPSKPGYDNGILVVPFAAISDPPGCIIDNPDIEDALKASLLQIGIECRVVGFDALTGEVIWDFKTAPWLHDHSAGSFYEYPGECLPDSAGGIAVGSDGIVYVHFMSGMVFAIDGYTGELVSSYDTYNSCNAQILIAPGMVVTIGGFAIFCWRDGELEKSWVQEAKAKGDPRAKVPLLELPFTCDEVCPKVVDPEKDAANYPLACCLDVHKDLWKGPQYAQEVMDREAAFWKEQWLKDEQEAIKLQHAFSKMVSATHLKTANPAPAGGVGSEWKVVGGLDKGILVRKERNLQSAELGRLSKNARIQEMERIGDRIHYKKLDGDGPQYGWITVALQGKPLIILV